MTQTLYTTFRAISLDTHGRAYTRLDSVRKPSRQGSAHYHVDIPMNIFMGTPVSTHQICEID